MKKLLILLSLVCLKQASAQTWVTIPDAQFLSYLKTIVPTAINVNQLDISSSLVTTTTHTIDLSSYNSIADLTGLQYFSSLTYLYCAANKLTGLPALPNSLSYLDCSGNPLTSFPVLPNSLSHLNCSINNLSSLPALPGSLNYLDCDNNKLTGLPALPDSLNYLDCSQNNLSSLPALPDSLTELICDYNTLNVLPALPVYLNGLSCDYNNLSSLPALPDSLKNLSCGENKLTSLPVLPNLISLWCDANKLTSLPALPNSLTYLHCGANNLSNGLPALPNSLQDLECQQAQLTSLPALPKSVQSLNCSWNSLTSLPALPAWMEALYCYENQISCLPPIPPSIPLDNFMIDPNPFTCFSNYVPAMGLDTVIYPLCVAGNTSSCPAAAATCSANITYTLVTGAQGAQVNFSILSSGYSNVWHFGDPNSTGSTTGLNVQHVFSKNGTYIIQCVTKNSAGQVICISTDSIVLADVGIPSFVSPEDQVTLYPNPGNGSFTLETGFTDKQLLQVFDLTGQLLLSQDIMGKTSIDASHLSEGVYTLSIKTKNGVINKKLLIVK